MKKMLFLILVCISISINIYAQDPIVTVSQYQEIPELKWYNISNRDCNTIYYQGETEQVKSALHELLMFEGFDYFNPDSSGTWGSKWEISYRDEQDVVCVLVILLETYHHTSKITFINHI